MQSHDMAVRVASLAPLRVIPHEVVLRSATPRAADPNAVPKIHGVCVGTILTYEKAHSSVWAKVPGYVGGALTKPSRISAVWASA